jgi:hypothetical protein
MKYALIAAIEGDRKNLNNDKNIVKFDRLYESEAVICFDNWRKNGGWLKDIPIYVLCPTHNTISTETKVKLTALNVEYVEEYHPIIETFTSGFLNIPYVGKLFEDRLDVDIIIKIDLDMNLIQPLPEELVTCGEVVCGQYDDFSTRLQRTLEEGWTNPFDTGFMITRRDSGFYNKWWAEVDAILNDPDSDPEWIKVREQTGEYYLEEYIVDKLFHADPSILRPVQRYQIGEWYTPVAEFTDEELTNVYFWHEHLLPDPAYDKIRQKVEYFNRMRKIHDKQ